MSQRPDPQDTGQDTAPGTEPDPRFTLANERTFLAWMRTALALLAGAVALVQFAPDLGPQRLRESCAVGLAVLATVCAAGGLLRWRSTQHAMRTGLPLRTGWLPAVLGLGLGVVAVVLGLALVTGRG